MRILALVWAAVLLLSSAGSTFGGFATSVTGNGVLVCAPRVGRSGGFFQQRLRRFQ